MMKPTMAVPLFIMIVVLWLKFEVGPPAAGRKRVPLIGGRCTVGRSGDGYAARPSTSRGSKHAQPVFGRDGKRECRAGQVAARRQLRKTVDGRANPGVLEAVRHGDHMLVGPPPGAGD